MHRLNCSTEGSRDSDFGLIAGRKEAWSLGGHLVLTRLLYGYAGHSPHHSAFSSCARCAGQRSAFGGYAGYSEQHAAHGVKNNRAKEYRSKGLVSGFIDKSQRNNLKGFSSMSGLMLMPWFRLQRSAPYKDSACRSHRLASLYLTAHSSQDSLGRRFAGYGYGFG